MLLIRIFRICAITEAVTWIGLLFSMYEKYIADTHSALIHIMGSLHGYAWIAYVLVVFLVRAEYKWTHKAENAVMEKLLPHLDAGRPAVTADLTSEEKVVASDFFLLTSKPTLFACNVAESDLVAAVAGRGSRESPQNAAAGDRGYSAAQNVKAVRDYAKSHFATEAIVISAQIESELVDLSEGEAKDYLRDLGVNESGVGALIRAVYHLLGLRTYLTTGEKESRAWTIHADDKAPQAAGVIHTDFERGFIAAEVTHYDDLVALGSFAKAREAGKLRIEGKDYVVKDGDVIEFRFNV